MNNNTRHRVLCTVVSTKMFDNTNGRVYLCNLKINNDDDDYFIFLKEEPAAGSIINISYDEKVKNKNTKYNNFLLTKAVVTK